MTPTAKFLTPHQIANVLNVSPMTVYRLVNRGELPAYRIGHSYRIDPRDFADFMRGNVIDGGEW